MRILIAIHGSHATAARMQAQRETWINYIYTPHKWIYGWVHHRYFVGQPAVTTSRDDVEYGPYDDAPIWVREGQVNRRTAILNLKTQAICRYGLEEGYDYVFKCDDDTYVRPELLFESGFEEFQYSGNCEWHTFDELGWYQWAGGGGGYWLSRRAMLAVIEGGMRHPAEDTNVGQILAARGFKAHHDPRYRNAVTEAERRSPPADAITLHKCDPDQMRTVHRALYADPEPMRRELRELFG